MATQPELLKEFLEDGDGFRSWESTTLREGNCQGEAKLDETVLSAVTLPWSIKYGLWFSPEVVLDEPLQYGGKIVPSWQANTPPGSHLVIYLRVRRASEWSGWYPMFEWASNNVFRSRSMPAQEDEFGAINVDTYVNTTNRAVDSYQLQVELRSDGIVRPSVFKVAAQAMNKLALMPTSDPLGTEKIDLPVPELSQYQKFSGLLRDGGEGLCSPTTLAMLMKYHGVGPNLAAIRTYDRSERDTDEVDYTARRVYDWEYDGKGNWPFNTAYATQYGLDAVVRRFRSLRDVEQLLAWGIPSIISLSWDNDSDDPSKHLAGVSIPKSDGHLMGVGGHTEAGDIIAFDSATSEEHGHENVRRIYLRRQVETRWQEAGGIAYVIVPH